jgi:hypothetical protein
MLVSDHYQHLLHKTEPYDAAVNHTAGGGGKCHQSLPIRSLTLQNLNVQSMANLLAVMHVCKHF